MVDPVRHKVPVTLKLELYRPSWHWLMTVPRWPSYLQAVRIQALNKVLAARVGVGVQKQALVYARFGVHAAGFLTAVPVQLCVGSLSPFAISCFLACLDACLRASSTRSCMDVAGFLGAARSTARFVEDSAICPGPLHKCGVQCRVRWMLARRLRY